VNRRLTRRGFLALGLAAVSTVAVSSVVRRRERFPARSLLAIVPDVGLMAEFGRAARAEVGGDPAALARAVAPTGADARWVDRAPVDEVRAHLRNSVRSDFDEGRTIRVHGWVVSVTGARIAVIVDHAM